MFNPNFQVTKYQEPFPHIVVKDAFDQKKLDTVKEALLQVQDLRRRSPVVQYSKGTLEGMLTEMGIQRRVFEPDPSKIREGLFQLMVDTAAVVEQFHTPRWIHEHRAQIAVLNNPPQEFLTRIEQAIAFEHWMRDGDESNSVPF